MESRNLMNFIDIIYSIHIANAKNSYTAMDMFENIQREVMPITSFIYEYFIFNSLYNIDWIKTEGENKLIYYDDLNNEQSLSEFAKQKCFIKYLKDKTNTYKEKLFSAFKPITLINLEDNLNWTYITPDSRLKTNDGERFFNHLKYLKNLLLKKENLKINDFFDHLKESLYFVYLVRNNIFHGSKSLNDANEKNQKKRIYVYDLVLKCVNSLFFSINGKRLVSSDYQMILYPIWEFKLHDFLKTNGIYLTQIQINKLNTLLLRRKINDLFLLKTFSDKYNGLNVGFSIKNDYTLFYPSAGKDIFFPLLIGLPYCAKFFFYDVNYNNIKERLINNLKQLFSDICIKNFKDETVVRFNINDLQREIHLISRDNLTFFYEDVILKFYFHRGDSEGEGGSGQRWDSTLLPRLMEKIDETCYFITDGKPYGLDKSYCFEVDEINLLDNRVIYYGILKRTN